MLLVLVSQLQTIFSDWFANINADFILPSHFYACTEFLLSPLIVKPLQHAIESNRDQQRCWIPHCRLVYTGVSYDLPHSNRIKVKKTTAKTDHPPPPFPCNPRNRMECFLFLFISFSLTAKISDSSWNYRQCRSPRGRREGSGTPGTLPWLRHYNN